MKPDPEAFAKAAARNEHLRNYVHTFTAKGNKTPDYYLKIEKEMGAIEFPNLIYVAGEPVFVHIYRAYGEECKYYIIEPRLTKEEEALYSHIFDSLLMEAQKRKDPRDKEELRGMLNEVLDAICVENEAALKTRVPVTTTKKFLVNSAQKEALRYAFYRDIIGLGILEPFSRDPYIEDIFGSGLGAIFVNHKVFGMLKSNVILKSDKEVDEFCYRLGERMDKPLSDAIPIADGTLPDGSRANVIYTRSISRRGSSFSVRKMVSEPLSIPRIVSFGTMSAEMAAYLWLAIENGMNIFFCGEASCGKTSMLNACCSFIDPKAKIYTCEDTVEVTAPHKCWQQLTTSGGGKGGEGGVTMHDLLIASLRSRPNYIIVGEIRGAEGNIAFQAMQTGHPVMATFHSSSIRKMIQRLTGNPINVPVNFMDNLNIGVIMAVVYRKGVRLRRVLEVAEIEGFNPEAGGILTRTMFDWDTAKDEHAFKGMFNSYILEDKIAPALGYQDKRQIYSDLAERAKIIRELVRRRIFDYYEVFDIIRNYWYYGKEGLPFKLE